jgi:hypothetical protein
VKVGIWTTMRLQQSNQGHSMACLALVICKYHVPYFLPCFNLQSMIILDFKCTQWMLLHKRLYYLWGFWCDCSFCWYRKTKPNWLVSVVSNFAKVAYAWAKSSLLLICKTSLKITKRKSEFIYRGFTFCFHYYQSLNKKKILNIYNHVL